LSFQDFFPADDLSSILRDYQLNFLESTSNPIVTEPGQLNADALESDLAARLKTDTANTFVRYVQSRASEQQQQADPVYVRTITKVVTEGALEGLGGPIAGIKLNKELFNKYCTDILQNLIKGKVAELNALFELQALLFRLDFPSGLLANVFESLYELDVITPDTFTAWKTDNSATNQQGKGVAVHSSIQFFTWMEESENGDEDEDGV